MSEQLETLIQQELEVLEELNKASLLKKDALLNDDIQSLEDVILMEERLSLSFKKLDDACSQQVQFFLREESDGVNIPPHIKKLLLRLRKSATVLQSNNRFNQELIEDSLGLLRFTINVFTSNATNETNTYSSAGKIIKKQAPNSLLDFKG